MTGLNADLAQLVRLALGRGSKDYQTEQDRIAPSHRTSSHCHTDGRKRRRIAQ
ncbi:hypothetical protein ACWWAE_02085 [Xylella fastidiosa subsp. multiplex]|uniref:hypothetical protein n=1 Tax=Xylella fastidiosa TaxID=2371 RepID=UPI0035D505CD